MPVVFIAIQLIIRMCTLNYCVGAQTLQISQGSASTYFIGYFMFVFVKGLFL